MLKEWEKNMELRDKKYFYFTQNSLNTFKSCPFRFKKKYIDNIKWQNEENMSFLENAMFGTDFHKIAERYFMGIPVYEDSFSDNEELYRAFMNLKLHFPLNSEFKYYPEYSIRYSDGNIRLEANIDLIIIKGNEIEIWDWKTNAKSDKEKYSGSLQTQIYMFTLKKCCESIFGKDFSNIRMIYFSPERKEEIVSITYSDEKYKKDEKYIEDLIEKVYNFEWEKFDRSKYIKQCKFCEFNLFCSSIKNEFMYEFSDLDWDDIEEVY